MRAFLAAITFSFLTVSCASDGQVLRPPSADQTTTSRPAPVTIPAKVLVSPLGLRLSSPDFIAGGPVPADATCDGANRFPALEWSGPEVSDGAELAISLTDQTDIEQPLLLWLVTGLPVSETNLESGAIPPEAVETLNDYGQSGFGSPCINTKDSEARSLQFRIHVLSSPSGIVSGSPGNESFAQVKSLTVDAAAVLMKVNASALQNAAGN